MKAALEIGFFVVVAVLVLLPPKYDPAIRWKERQERRRAEREKK